MRTVTTRTSEVTTPISAVAMVTCVTTTYPKILFQSPGELQRSPMDQVTKHFNLHRLIRQAGPADVCQQLQVISSHEPL